MCGTLICKLKCLTKKGIGGYFMTSFAINNQFSNFNQNHINGIQGIDVCYIDDREIYGFDRAIINKRPDYSSGFIGDNYQDCIHQQCSFQNPFIAQLANLFSNFIANFISAGNSNQNNNSNTNTSNNTTDTTNNSLPNMDDRTAVKTLLDHMDLLDTAADRSLKDNNFSKDDLRALASNDSIDPQLRAAAQHLLNNNPLFNSLHHKSVMLGLGEGLIGIDGLMRHLNG